MLNCSKLVVILCVLNSVQCILFDSFSFLNTTLVQTTCKKALESVLLSLQHQDLNALKMLDATAKIPSGLLSGNINQYGDYDECLQVPKAQYCLVEIDIEPLWDKFNFKHKELVHSHYFFKDNFKDPAHRIPGFSLVKWAFCMPQQCSPQDLQQLLRNNLGIESDIRSGMCQSNSPKIVSLTFGDYFTRTFFGIILFFALVGTVIDYYKFSDNAFTKFLICFSLKRNGKKMFEIKTDSNSELQGLHGIRFFSALGLLLSHKAMSLFYNPYMNRTSTVARLSKPWTIVAKNAIVYTDNFMVLSGLLNAHALFKDFRQGRGINFKSAVIHRIFRILPSLVAVILFCTYILPQMGSGPLWPIVIDHHSVLCRKYMWRNFFFIHNYFGFENMCLTHTHQLGIDMQLFILTPILMNLIWKNRRLGLLIMLVMAIASTILRFWISYKHEISSVIYFGVPVSKIFATANLSYILPTHRATIYLIGVYLAYILNSNKTINISKAKSISMWIFVLSIFFLSWFGPHKMVNINYVYEKFENSLISAITPITWGSCIAFSIYAMQNNFGMLGKILCWKYFQIFTKIAYALYLVQFPVFFYNVGITRHVDEYKPHFQLQLYETVTIVIFSISLVLLIEMPFQNLKEIMSSKDSSSIYKENKLKRASYKTG